MQSYSHFRTVQDQTKRDNLMLDDAIFKADFLDEAARDLPMGCWSIQTVDMNTALIRNNIWKGFTAYHTCDTQKHGCIYIGDGLKNDEFAFM